MSLYCKDSKEPFLYKQYKTKQRKRNFLTLDDDVSSSMHGINIIGGKTGILSTISLDHILNIQPTRRGDVYASIVGQGRTIAFSPGDPGLWLTCGTALQGHTLSHQNLCVLGLNHKTWPCWKDGGEGRGERGKGFGSGYRSFKCVPGLSKILVLIVS